MGIRPEQMIFVLRAIRGLAFFFRDFLIEYKGPLATVLFLVMGLYIKGLHDDREMHEEARARFQQRRHHLLSAVETSACMHAKDGYSKEKTLEETNEYMLKEVVAIQLDRDFLELTEGEKLNFWDDVQHHSDTLWELCSEGQSRKDSLA